MDYNIKDDTPVVTDWDGIKSCMFARKCWVNPSNVNKEKSYEIGDFLRVWCDHDGWCSACYGVDFCRINQDHEKD